MADQKPTTNTDMWNYLIARREFALRRVRGGKGDVNELWAIVSACEETMLGLVAPDLSCVRVKLGLMWSGTLNGNGLSGSEAAATLLSAWQRGSNAPTFWLSIVRDYVYLAAQDIFFNPESQTALKRAGFNGMYGRPHAEASTLAEFVLANGYIEKVNDISYDPRHVSGIMRKNGADYYNTYKPSDVTPIAGDASRFFEF